METVYIETERLVLRSWKPSDRKAFAQMNGNDEVMRFFPSTLTTEESDKLADRIESELEECGLGLYAVEIKETGAFIGYVGFHRFNFDAPFSPGLEIGWRISSGHWHKGYATEAAKACVDYARKIGLTGKVYSFTAVPNLPSENVMKRIGMTYSGRFLHPALCDGHWLKLHKLYFLEL